MIGINVTVFLLAWRRRSGPPFGGSAKQGRYSPIGWAGSAQQPSIISQFHSVVGGGEGSRGGGVTEMETGTTTTLRK